jgi:hypothetical protein
MDSRPSEFEQLAAEKLRLEVQQLRAEDEQRSRRYLRLGITFSTVFITVIAAVVTFYFQTMRRAEVESLLQKEIAVRSEELRRRELEARRSAETVIAELEKQRERLTALQTSTGVDIDTATQAKVAALSSQVGAIELEMSKLKDAKLSEKMSEIEKSLGADITKVLSVPLLRANFDSFKSNVEKDLLRVEKGLEALESRLNFFVTTTITLSLGIFAAVLAPRFISFIQRRTQGQVETLSEEAAPNKQMQPTARGGG